jgi:hypothetical protein
MGAHVGFEQHPAIPGDDSGTHRLSQVRQRLDALGHGRQALLGSSGAHQQAMAGEAHGSQPGQQVVGPGAGQGVGLREPAVGKVGAAGQQFLADGETPLGVEKHHALETCGQKWHSGMGTEAALAGDRQRQAGVRQGQLGLGAASIQGSERSRHATAEAAQLVRVNLAEVAQLGSQAMAQGAPDHPFLAVTGGQGHPASRIGGGIVRHRPARGNNPHNLMAGDRRCGRLP